MPLKLAGVPPRRESIIVGIVASEGEKNNENPKAIEELGGLRN
jgi:hypothetical protein